MKIAMPILVRLFYTLHILFVSALPFTPLSSFAFLAKNDKDYFKYDNDTSNALYIFSQDHATHLEELVNFHRQIMLEYDKSFGYKLYGKTNVVFTSYRNQVANAFATLYPFNTNVYYSGGTSLVDDMAETSWSKGLIIHEMGHLYQLNPSEGFGDFTRRIFGTYLFFVYPIIPIPLFPQPNIILPTLLLEGNSVLNESRFQNGGRLYSGAARAVFYRLLKENLLDETRLLNAHLSFPYSAEKYLIGGYYNLYLANKFGIDKTNQFFKVHGQHYFLPIILNSTFKEHFGKSFSQTISDFLDSYREEASLQVASNFTNNPNIKILAKSQIKSLMNSDQENIFFMINSDGRRENQIASINKKTLQVSLVNSDLPNGKLFILNNEYYSATSSTSRSQDETFYSLWGKNRSFLEEYKYKDVNDIRAATQLYFDVNKSFTSPRLFLKKYSDNADNSDNSDLGDVNSRAILDDTGNAYFFKQKENKRVLYRFNQNGTGNDKTEELCEYDGHYGRLIDVNKPKNLIYFIAATKYGESLFACNGKNHSFSRLSPLDTIANASLIDDNRFLIAEFSPDGYIYHIITVTETPTSPAAYEYAWDKDNHSPPAVTPSATIPLPQEEISSYHMLPAMRLSNWNMHYSKKNRTTGSTTETKLVAQFSDPLQQNHLFAEGVFNNQNIDAAYQRYFHSNSINHFSLTYLNEKYILNWFSTLHLYQNYYNRENSILPASPLSSDRNKLAIEAGVILPYEILPHFILTIKPTISYIHEYETGYYEKYLSLLLKKSRSGPLSLFPYELLQFHLEGRQNYQGKEAATEIGSMIALPWESFLALEGEYHYANQISTTFGVPIEDSSNPALIASVGKTVPGDRSNKAFHGLRGGIALSTVINYGAYYRKFFLSVRRFGPRILSNYLYHNYHYHYDYQTDKEFGGGITLDLLLAHTFPLKLNMDYVRRVSDKNETVRFTIGGNI
ncbi:MAG: hypothetical protein HQK53_03370 [Oligoflexia bacterium]|nr:hypothetical protein [Oligoflexia bacterium]